MAKRRADKELTDRNWDQEDEVEEAGEIEVASEDTLKGRQILKGKRRGATATDQNKEFTGFAGFSFKPSAASTPFSFNVRSVTNGSVEKQEEKTEKNENQNGQSTSNGTENKKSYLSSLKNLNESVLAWIKSHVDKNPFCILTPVFKDYEKHLAEIMKSKDADKTEIVGVDEKSKDETKKEDSKKEDSPKEDIKTTEIKTTPCYKYRNAQKSPLVSETGATTKADDTETKSTGFSFGNAFHSSTTTTSTQSKPLGSGVQFGSTFSSSTAVPSFPGFNFKPSTVTQPAASGFSFGAVKPKEGEGSQEEDDEYVPPKAESTEIKEEGAVHSIKCKLFYQKDGLWTERGVGFLHLKPSEGKLQLIVRTDTALGNILLNIILSPSIPLQRQGKNNISMVCVPNPPIDKKSDAAKPVPMLIRVKTAEDADELLEKMEEHRKTD